MGANYAGGVIGERRTHFIYILIGVFLVGFLVVCMQGVAGQEMPEPVAPGDDINQPATINQSGTYDLTRDIDSGTGEAAIYINASDVTLNLNGYTITNNSSMAGILVQNATNVTVNGEEGWVKNFTGDNNAGISFKNASEGSVNNVTTYNNFVGMAVINGSDIVGIHNNTINDSMVGVAVDQVSDIGIHNNQITNSGYSGVHVTVESNVANFDSLENDNTFTNNENNITYENSVTGPDTIDSPGTYYLTSDIDSGTGDVAITIYNTDDVTLNLNGHTITNNSSMAGILVQNSNIASIKGEGGTITNFTSKNGGGIYFPKSNNSSIRDTHLLNNSVGVGVGEGAQHVEIYDNTIENHSSGVQVQEESNVANFNSLESDNTFINNTNNITVEESESTQYSLTFSVENPTGSAIEGVSVNLIDVGSNQTDVKGTATFSVSNGTYEYEIKKDGHVADRGTVTIDGANETVNIKLISVRFDVEDENSTGINNATIELYSDETESPYHVGTLETDENGTAVFSVANDTVYEYDIQKEHFEPYHDNATIAESNVTVNATLTEKHAITFNINDTSGDDLENASVGIHGIPVKQTDSNGSAVFWVPNGTYNYEVWADRYQPEKNNVTVAGANETVNLTLKDAPNALTFTVENESGAALEDTGVHIENATKEDQREYYHHKQTDENGDAVFWVANNTTFRYNIGYEGYVSQEDTVEIGEENVSVPITLREVEFTITINVVDEEGSPLPDTRIGLYGDEYDVTYNSTNDNGVAQFDVSDLTEYTYVADAPGKIHTGGKISSDSLDEVTIIEMQDQDPTRFSGYTMYPNGTVLSGVNVSVKGYNGDMWENDSEPELLGSALSNESGYFNITGMPNELNDSEVEVYVIDMRKWDDEDDEVLEYMSESNLRTIWNRSFVNLGTQEYVLSEAAKFNVSGVGTTEFRRTVDGIAIDENRSTGDYSRSLVWMNDTDRWAYIGDDDNLTILDADFTRNSTVEIPVKDPQGLYFDEDEQVFYTMNSTEADVGETYVWTFNSSGQLTGEERYNITDNSTDRYHSVAGIEYHNGSYYIWGENATTDDPGIVDKYNETFQYVETVLDGLEVGNDLHQHEEQWYLAANGEVAVYESDWEPAPLNPDNVRWHPEWNATGIANNGSEWYFGVNETDEIRNVRLTDQGIKRFGYEVIDAQSGTVIERQEKGDLVEDGVQEPDTVSNFSFYGVADREYSIHFSKRLSALNAQRNFDGIDDIREDDDAEWNETTRELQIRMNLTEELRRVSGHVEHNGSDDFTNISAVYYEVIDQQRPDYKAGYKRGLLYEEDDVYRPEEGYYNLSLIDAPAYDSEYLLFVTAYNETEDQYYGALQTVTLGDEGAPVENNNMSLKPLLGQESSLPTYSTENGTEHITTALKRFQFVNETNQTITPSWYHSNIYMDYSAHWPDTSTQVAWQRSSERGERSYFEIPVFEGGDEGMYVNAYATDSNPQRVSLRGDRLAGNDTVNITLGTATESEMVLEAGDTPDIETYLYRGATGDTPIPTETDTLSATYVRDRPLDARLESQQQKLNLLGGNISFRMTDINNDITVHYSNVDTSRPGTPDAFFTSQAEVSGAGDDFESLWKFGSSGPSIYDKVLVSMPYNESAGENHTVHIPYLYDEDMNVIWDAENNTTDEIPSHYSTYVEDDEYSAYVDGTGVECQVDNPDLSEGLCYKDTENTSLWMEIPHFSAVGLNVGTADDTDGDRADEEDDSTDDTPPPPPPSGDDDEPEPAPEPVVEEAIVDEITGEATAAVDASAGQQVEIQIPSTAADTARESMIEGISATSGTDQQISVSVRSVDREDVTVPARESQVSFEEINVEGDVEGATVTFSVRKDTLDDHGADPADVVKERFDPEDEEWQQLETTVSEELDDRYRFEAEVPEFSLFATSIEAQEEPVTEEPPTEEPATVEEPPTEEPATVEEPPTEEPATVEEPPTEEPPGTEAAVDEEPVTEQPSEGTRWTSLLALVVLLAFAAVGFYFYIRRKE